MPARSPGQPRSALLNLRELLRPWRPAGAAPPAGTPPRSLSAFRYGRHAIELAYTTSPALCIGLGLLTVLAGVLPAGVAWIGAHIVDAVVGAIRAYPGAGNGAFRPVLG